MGKIYTPQLKHIQLNQFLTDTSPDFPKYRQWLAKNNGESLVCLAAGTLQAINRHWVDLECEQSRLDAFLVYLFKQIAGNLHLLTSSSQAVFIVRDVFTELKIFLTRPKFITIKNSDDKMVQNTSDALSLEPLFGSMMKFSNRPPLEHKKNQDKGYLNINTVVSLLPTLYQRELINLPMLNQLISHLGSLADRNKNNTVCLHNQENFNHLLDLLANGPCDSALSSALLLSLGKLAAADLFNQALSLGSIHKLLKPLESQKNAPVEQWCHGLQGVARLLTALKVTSAKDLDIKALCKLGICLIQTELPRSVRIIVDSLQSLERIHFYTDNPCEIPLEVLLQAKELVVQQSAAEYKNRAITGHEFIKQLGSAMLSIGQLIQTNIPYYYLRITGTRWIKTIDDVFESLAGMLQNKKIKADALPFPVFKCLIYALNGRVLAGKSSADEHSNLVFKCILAQSSYLTDSVDLSYVQRQKRLKLARQLYLYALVTHQEKLLPPGVMAFLEKNRPVQPSDQSFEAKVVKELKDKFQVVTQVSMETGPVLYPFDILVSREDKEDSIQVDVEMKGPKHLTRIQTSKDLFRDGVLSFVKATDVIVPFFWHKKPTVAGVVNEILTAEAQWDNRERPELHEWIGKNFCLDQIPISAPTEEKKSLPVVSPASTSSNSLTSESSMVSTTGATVSSTLPSAPQVSSRKKKSKMPAEKKISISKPVELVQWIELATQGTNRSF